MSKIKVICTNCGKEFDMEHHRVKGIQSRGYNTFCSKECRDKYYRVKTICDFCGKEFDIRDWQIERNKEKGYNTFCSIKCRGNYTGYKVELVCKNCGIDFIRYNSEVKKNKSYNYFCSKQCYKEYSQILLICDNCGSSFYRKRKNISNSVKRGAKNQFCSHKCHYEYRSLNNRDVYHKFYGSKEWINIRKKVLERDGYSCQLCGYDVDISNLSIHHKKPLREFDTTLEASYLSNLITLCKSCHSKVEQAPINIFIENINIRYSPNIKET